MRKDTAIFPQPEVAIGGELVLETLRCGAFRDSKPDRSAAQHLSDRAKLVPRGQLGELPFQINLFDMPS